MFGSNRGASQQYTQATNPFGSAQAQQQPAGLVGGAMSQPAPLQAESTVEGRVRSIIADDGKLMQQARTTAMEGMNQRGLVNSSMAAGAAQQAVLSAATPIAQQDAQAQQTRDATAQQQQFTREQSATQQQHSLDQLQAQQQFTREQAATQQQYSLDQLRTQYGISKAQVPQTFAASIATTLNEKIATIASDGTLDANAKRAAIQNMTDSANASLSWAEKFYSATMPKIGVPG
jgi:hypothetical protein